MKSLSVELKQQLWDFYGVEEFNRIHDCITEFYDVEVTPDILKNIVLVLPDNIIGLGIEWSFGDTEVGDATYNFIKNNTKLIDPIVYGNKF